MKGKLGIRKKLTQLIIIIVIISMIAVAACSIISMNNMRQKALQTAKDDVISQLSALASGKTELADAMLTRAQNQTLLVAEGMKNVFENSDYYLKGIENATLPNLTCAGEGDDLVKVIVPENLLKNIQKDENGNIAYAELDTSVNIGDDYTIEEELYMGLLIKNELSQIYHFRTAGTEDEYKGFAASYFCFADSGMDVIGDPKHPSIITADLRKGGWYNGAIQAYNDGTLTEAGVYWTEPEGDAAGRGTSMKCATPVVVNGKIVGVAGSGGLINDFADLVNGSAIGSTGYSFMISRNTSKVIINSNSDDTSEIYLQTDLSTSTNQEILSLVNEIKEGKSGIIEDITIDGVKSYLAYSPLNNNDWTMVTVISQNDQLIMSSYKQLNTQIQTAFIVFISLIVVLIIIAIFVTRSFSKSFTNPIEKLTNDVAKIGDGNFDYKSDVKTGDEIETLSVSFEKMTHSLKHYIENLTKITAENERIGAELNVANHIQASMLPCIFPAFPDRKEFDIHATMNPAKEVGGDFYDFFMVDEKHIAIVMADVSGKGIPAALFMVIGKTLIKDHTQLNQNLSDVFTEVNDLLCEANSQGLFITAFEGVLDLETGEFNFVNAGHEMPFIYHNNTGKYEVYKTKPGFVLAGMEGMRFKGGTMQLEVGDRIFQYTDGVTEATDANNNLFGMERLEESLNKCINLTPKGTLFKVHEDVDAFVGEAPQFDDITMLCLEYKEKYNKK